MRKLVTLAIAVGCVLLLWGDQARGGILLVDKGDGGGGPYINLIVREIKATPVRAHVGDVIRVDVVIEDRGDLNYAKGDLEIKANGRTVASRRMGDDVFRTEGDRIFRATFQWDTGGVKPGSYMIRAECFVWGDASEFDNFLDLEEPLTLLAPEEAFSAGQSGGGEAISRDPRYRPRSSLPDRPPVGCDLPVVGSVGNRH